MRFLHSMRIVEYLEQALKMGLMLTNHEVRLNLSDDRAVVESALEEIWPSLQAQLSSIGTPWNSLAEVQRSALVRALGTVTGQVPMLCFTEVPAGRDLWSQHLAFGAYGVVVTSAWLTRHSGDRVLYLGENSAVTRIIHRIIATLKVSSLYAGPNGQPLFPNHTFQQSLDLVAYVETRGNLPELEWRVIGNPGFFEGPSDVGNRIALPIADIETVLVQNDADVLLIL